MKCTLKAKCNKEIFLKNTSRSIGCKYVHGYSYGLYNTKLDVELDKYRLRSNKIECEIIKGWKINGMFVYTRYSYEKRATNKKDSKEN